MEPQKKVSKINLVPSTWYLPISLSLALDYSSMRYNYFNLRVASSHAQTRQRFSWTLDVRRSEIAV